jgi:hypothetical protein
VTGITFGPLDRFGIDLEDRVIEPNPGQGIVVPEGAPHRPRAPERTVSLVVEPAGRPGDLELGAQPSLRALFPFPTFLPGPT